MSQHLFSQVPHADIPRSAFSRTHGVKTTFNADYLIPIYVDEVYPGDTFKISMTTLARLSTPVVPVMDNAYLDVFAFFVPNRLVWSNWQKFMGEQENPGDSTDYLVPVITTPSGGFKIHSLFDYLGWPVFVEGTDGSALVPRGYNLIWNEWFRDENLQNRAVQNKGDGPDVDTDYPLRKRGKRHDYFTSALPWPQKGPGVELPLGTEAPVIGTGMTLGFTDGTTNAGMTQIVQGGLTTVTAITQAYGQSVGTYTGNTLLTGPKNIGVTTDPEKSGLVADLSNATAATINSLRQAFAVQRLFERDARGGTRYTEILKAHFGVTSPDARLQRPEYLAGAEAYVNITPVVQTSSTDTTTPQGNLAATGVVSLNDFRVSKSFVEHGHIIILMSVRTDLSYQQGLNRMYQRRTRFDYYWPALAFLGEQEVKNSEIYMQDKTVLDTDGTPLNDKAFGYQERWAELRYYPNQITGQMRSNSKDSQGNDNSLDIWHYAQWFENMPVLNDEFIESNSPIKRSLAVQGNDAPDFIFDGFIQVKAVRPLPVYSVPGLLDHF